MNEEIPNQSDINKWAGGVHVAAFLTALLTSWSAGIGGMVAALVVYFIKKDESAFIRGHAVEAFNFNFSMFVYSAVAIVFSILTLGLGLIIVIPMALILIVIWLVCTIQAASAGFDGKTYQYPLSIKILS